jgi:hypothetical protein
VSKETKVTGLDADIEKLGSDIDALALGVDAYLVDSARKLAPGPLTQAQVRALILGCRENGASRAGQRTGFGITAKTAEKLLEMKLLIECYVTGDYFTTAAGKLVLEFPENKRRADTMRRLGTT